jgi:DNA invertase Pin-like site-specific DNA recombinase
VERAPGMSLVEQSEGPPIRAAQYVRMSTEHQKYSTENQAEIIAQYAAKRGFEIVRTYEDAGKSGLRLEGRLSLQRLIADVRSGSADFAAVLVYDVSRWAASRTRTKAPTTSSSAAKRASRSTIAPNSSRMTAASARPSSRA